MLIWSTQFPITPTRDVDELLTLSKKWLIGSPHSSWTEECFGKVESGDMQDFKHDGQCVTIARFSDEINQWCAFRYSWHEDASREWKIDICGWKSHNRFLIGIQLHCQVADIGDRVPKPRKPYIVRQILKEFGGDIDDCLPVSEEPVYLKETDIDFAARILRGETKNYLPIVYVSSKYGDQPSFPPEKLAEWASGMAHVIVEPSRVFSHLIAKKTKRRNPYDGAVGVCWPQNSGKQTRLFSYDYPSVDRFATAIADVVREALAGRIPDYRCTWEHIREQISRERLESLRRLGKEEVDNYSRCFDDEIESKNLRIAQLERENVRLRSEMLASNHHNDGKDGIFVLMGKECEIFSGEQIDSVLYALSIARNQVFNGGRVQAILDSILEANKYTGERDKLMDVIRNTIGGCDSLGGSERKKLTDIGFSITEEGKHIKLVFREDDRYTFPVPKTGSDYRGMKNTASDINKKLFK